MLIPREGSLLLAASGSLRIVCEPTAVNLVWNLIFGINHQTCGPAIHNGGTTVNGVYAATSGFGIEKGDQPY